MHEVSLSIKNTFVNANSFQFPFWKIDSKERTLIWNIKINHDYKHFRCRVRSLPHSQSKKVRGQHSQSGWRGPGMSVVRVHGRSLNTSSWRELHRTTHNHTSCQLYGSGCSRSGPRSSCTASLRAEQTDDESTGQCLRARTLGVTVGYIGRIIKCNIAQSNLTLISPYRSGELSTWKVSLLFTYTMALYSSIGAEYVYWKNNNGFI